MGFNIGKALALGGLFGGEDDEVEEIKRPEFFTDPLYTSSQKQLSGMGTRLMEGDLPEWLQPITETGSQQFEDVLGLTKRDITQSTQEALAKGGRARGGQLGASTAKAIGDVSIKARFEDYLRAQRGKESMFGKGVDITTGVRGSGERYGAAKNRFNWQDYGAEVGERDFQLEQERLKDEQLGSLLGTVASVGMGIATGGASLPFSGILSKLGKVGAAKPAPYVFGSSN